MVRHCKFHCTLRSCSKPVFALTLCQYHYRQYRVRCMQCTRPVYCRSLCRTHYRQAAALKTFPPEPICTKCSRKAYINQVCIYHFKQQFDRSCAVINCPRDAHKRGLCCTHYFQFRRSKSYHKNNFSRQ